MIIEQIDKKRLMIMLESEDMNSLELTYENISWKNYKFKLLVAKLLALAKFKTGFSVDNCKLSIETIPQGLGCVIIFTLFPDINIESSSKKQHNDFNIEENNDTVDIVNTEPFIYKFDSVDDLFSICGKLSKMRKTNIIRSSVVKLGGSYHILVYPKNIDLPLNVSTILSEYGDKIKFSRTLEAYLYEFGQIIHNKNAITHIGKCLK